MTSSTMPAQTQTQTQASATADRLRRERMVVGGVVQGVGFRPHVARLARRHHLVGTCHNSTTAVTIEVQGRASAVAAFAEALVGEAPPMAHVLSLTRDALPLADDTEFHIERSVAEDGGRTLVPPDVAVCEDCVREMHDPADRRHLHPFITCTNCGPRLTIISGVPYDRPATSMAGFDMCPECAAEYTDPGDRRYHAQPICCPECGPVLRLLTPTGELLAGGRDRALVPGIVARVRAALLDGQVVAVKGIGGFHLAVDARRSDAVTLLRERKQRPDQPFALLARDVPTADAVVELSATARTVLTSPARPIVVLPARHLDGAERATGSRATVAPEVAPGLGDLGVMLPYAPIHHLLLDDDLPLVVMTSGNVSGEPLVTDEDDAIARLGPLTDLILSHDRPILVPCEDSVVTLQLGPDVVGAGVDISEADGGGCSTPVVPIRRSRGFAPLPVAFPVPDVEASTPSAPSPVVLAAGAEVKNTAALARDGWAFVSPHVGDLESLRTRRALESVTDDLLAFHAVRPDLVVADAHPGYASRAWAQETADRYGVPLVTVQHHHAHLASLAAETDLDAPLLGLVLDGTGYGCDETIWGGELLLLTDRGARADRLGHLSTWPLPGGDAGVRSPARLAVAALLAAGIDPGEHLPSMAALRPGERRAIESIITGRTGWVATSSAGRLFDVVSSLLGVRQRITYEAQAAIELQAEALRAIRGEDAGAAIATARALLPEPLVIPHADDPGRVVLDTGSLLGGLVTLLDRRPPAPDERPLLALAAHDWVANGIADLAARAVRLHDLPADVEVGLTGGCFQNTLLLALTRAALAERGLRARTHRVVPANDGGLCLGQAAVALARGGHTAASCPPDASARPGGAVPTTTKGGR